MLELGEARIRIQTAFPCHHGHAIIQKINGRTKGAAIFATATPDAARSHAPLARNRAPVHAPDTAPAAVPRMGGPLAVPVKMPTGSATIPYNIFARPRTISASAGGGAANRIVAATAASTRDRFTGLTSFSRPRDRILAPSPPARRRFSEERGQHRPERRPPCQ